MGTLSWPDKQRDASVGTFERCHKEPNGGNLSGNDLKWTSYSNLSALQLCADLNLLIVARDEFELRIRCAPAWWHTLLPSGERWASSLLFQVNIIFISLFLSCHTSGCETKVLRYDISNNNHFRDNFLLQIQCSTKVVPKIKVSLIFALLHFDSIRRDTTSFFRVGFDKPDGEAATLPEGEVVHIKAHGNALFFNTTLEKVNNCFKFEKNL